MHEALGIFAQIRARAGAENGRLAHKHGLASVDAPIGALNIIHQQATLSSEVLSYYIGWSRHPANATNDVAKRRTEDNQRVITLEKSALVMSVSAVEAFAKSAVAEYPDRLGLNGGRVYLSKVIRQSACTGLLSPEMERGWEAVLEIRNTF